jgi:hypothetical protein
MTPRDVDELTLEEHGAMVRYLLKVQQRGD